MDNLNKSLEKVSLGAPSKPSVFTFVPVVRKLPIETIITEEQRLGAVTEKLNQNFPESHEKETSGQSMSDRKPSRAEIVFIRDSEEGGAGNAIQTGIKPHLKPDHVTVSQSDVSLPARAENTPAHVAAGTTSMETAVDKHWDISPRRCRNLSGLAEVSSGFFACKASASGDRSSPANTPDLFPTPASSRESILSDASEKEKSWSGVPLSSVTSPASFSRTVSPCSSVRSGFFTPSVVQVKRHFLAPGSSLLHTPQTCFSSCESLSSIGPPSDPPRHRPPLTRLSLLTAILRKGRLPNLSPALQRPYTPCWPVNPVTLSFCNACSAASSVASIPLELSSHFSSTASIDSQSQVHREPSRCVTAPPPVQSNGLRGTCAKTQVKGCTEQIRFGSAPRWEQVISPPLPLFRSTFQSFPPPKKEIDYATPKKQQQRTHVSVSKSPELKPSNTHMYFKGFADNNLKKLISPSAKLINEQETQANRKWSHPPGSTLSKLHSLSQQLRSPPPSCLSQPRPAPSCSPSVAHASPRPPPQITPGRCEAGRNYLDGKSATKGEGSPKSHCLSPSRYTTMVFSGWPSPSGSRTPTPSLPCRDLLTPSPSLSMRSTPSPRPGSGISDCGDREGKKRKTHKIKSSYKSLAAIPTNTLLMDQQAIDEQVEREDSSRDELGRREADTHAEMCSPSQLRQQSEELYAVIDEILANSNPASKSSQQSSRSSTNNTGLQNNSTFPKSLGRETKYASLSSLYPSSSFDRKLMDSKKTKPGVIRPMTAIPRLTVEDEEEFYLNPFRECDVKKTSSSNNMVEPKGREEAGKDFSVSSKGQMWRDEFERRTPFSVCDLQITEPEDLIHRPVKDTSPSFSHTEGRLETFETHI